MNGIIAEVDSCPDLSTFVWLWHGFASAGWHPDTVAHYLHVTDDKRANKWRQMRSEWTKRSTLAAEF